MPRKESRGSSLQLSLFDPTTSASAQQLSKARRPAGPPSRRADEALNKFEIQFYSDKLEIRYLKSYGENYEDFVADVLSRRYPGDFIPVSSGGGDNKNDGIIQTTRELFQCYAPNKYDTSTVNRKIREDYLGAIEHWDEHFDVWRLAWCHPKAGSPDKSTTKLILDLQAEKGKKISFFQLSDLISLALGIPRSALIAWLGSPPVLVTELGFELELHEIKWVCESILDDDDIPDDDEDIEPVPPTKLDYNKIPENIREYLEKGKSLAGRVRYVFANDQDPLFGDRVAQKFNQEYLRQQERHPDHPSAIYWGLFDVIRHRTPDNLDKNLELAAHAILSYLFDRCDIFERPPEGWQGHAK